MRMNASQAEKGRAFLINWLFTDFYGLAFTECVRLLFKHRFDVDPPLAYGTAYDPDQHTDLLAPGV